MDDIRLIAKFVFVDASHIIHLKFIGFQTPPRGREFHWQTHLSDHASSAIKYITHNIYAILQRATQYNNGLIQPLITIEIDMFLVRQFDYHLCMS